MIYPMEKRKRFRKQKIVRLRKLMDESLDNYQIKRYLALRREYYAQIRMDQLLDQASRN